MNVSAKIKKPIRIRDHIRPISGKEGADMILVPLLITAVIAAVSWYMFLPACNLQSPGFWIWIMSLTGIYLFLKLLRSQIKKKPAVLKRAGIALIAMAAAFVLAVGYSAKIFHARRYSQILNVEEGSVELIPSAEGSSSIALMDTSSAEMLGDRKIGSLSQVVSQFNIAGYTQINYQDAPFKVAALVYDGIFKWNANKERGIPGYVIVDPVDMSADYVALKEGMKYVPSAWFNQNLFRRLRFAFPTLMFDNVHFEIDEEGDPYYVASVFEHKIGLFGGKNVIGALIADPISGEISYYPAGSVPQWADDVYDGDLICAQYNNYAQLQHGFFNSIFSQTDCRQITTLEDEEESLYNDYGYIAKDGDIWIYTGVTSVNGDSSNIGFVLANERTSETRFIPSAGADEFSAMKSAEGEVQEKRYRASFPSLINIEGSPAYIMVLKDANGLVKMYAIVNVEQYNIVATANTQAEAIEKYRHLIHGEDYEPAEEKDLSLFAEQTIVIKKIETIVRGGDTYIYIVAEDDHIYHARYADVLGMLLREEGDTLVILTDGEQFILPE